METIPGVIGRGDPVDFPFISPDILVNRWELDPSGLPRVYGPAGGFLLVQSGR